MGLFGQPLWAQVLFGPASPAPPQAASCVVTLSTLQTKVLDRLDNNTQLYPLSEVATFINEAVRVSNLHTGFLQGSFTTTSVANRGWYDFPQGTLFPLRIQFADFYLQATGINQLGQRKPNWQMETTATTGRSVSEWAPYGLKRFAIYPADAIGGATITATCVLEPTLLVNSSDAIQLPGQEYTDLIVDYSQHIALLKEGGKAFSDTMPVFQKFLSKVRSLSAFQGRRMPFYGAEVSMTGVR